MRCTAIVMNNTPSLDPRQIGALVGLINQERLGEAERAARTLLAIHPNAGMLWKVLGVALMRQGKDALQALVRTTELLPLDGEAHGNLGAALHDQGRFTESLTSLRRALELEPHNVEALVDAADAMRALGRSLEAVSLYRRALELDPKLTEARNNLGNALVQLRQYDDAANWYRLALEIKPQDAEIHCNLANVQRLQGRLEEAIESSRRAIALDPRLAIGHHHLGLALAAQGQREGAVASYRQALMLNPSCVEALNSLGDVLFEMRRLGEAAANYCQVLALAPRHAPAHLSLGIVLRAQRRHTDAEASCRAALAIEPNFTEALSFLGELKADRGQFAEAEELFRRAIEVDPDFSFGYASIATHRKMTAEDTEWLAGARALLAKQLPLGHEVSLHYALGKYFDDVGRYDEAFGHYRQANELTKRVGSSYDGARLTQRVDAIIANLDAAFLKRCGAVGSATEVPVFIIGMPRSGTSLTEQILASHPDVFGAGEVTFWDAAFLAYQNAGLAGDAAHSPARANLISSMAGDYLERLTTASGMALRVVDKMPANFLYAGLIHAAFPRARIIHMKRHPIDTCLSIYFQNFFNMDPYANDLDNLGHYYREYVRITDHWRAVLPATALLEVSYEALIEDQEGCTRRMLDFVGLPWDPKCLDFHQTDRVVITASKWQVRQKIHAASAGRWHHYEKHVEPLRRLLNLPA
jgi:tetratricopeptide (TPR) repeat protein